MWSSTHDDDVSRVGLLLSLSPVAVVVSSAFSMSTSSSSVSSVSMASRRRGVAACARFCCATSSGSQSCAIRGSRYYHV